MAVYYILFSLGICLTALIFFALGVAAAFLVGYRVSKGNPQQMPAIRLEPELVAEVLVERDNLRQLEQKAEKVRHHE